MDQIVLIGKESLRDIVTQYGIKNAFIVCGKTSFIKSGASAYIKKLGISVSIFFDFSQNPQYFEVLGGVEAFLEDKYDAIIAIGGGSAIDVAKCIKLFSSMDSNIPYEDQDGHDIDIPFVAIPTTAGSGSESTKHIVYYKEGLKQSISKCFVMPDYAILEEEFLRSLPDYQKKSTLLDALCQAIESYWSKGCNQISRVYAMQAIRIIKKYWKGYIFDNKNYKEMLYASNLAGKAINISKTTAAHAMSYGLTTQYGLSHGHAVSLCLDRIWPILEARVKTMEGSAIGDDTVKYIFDLAESISYSEFHDLLEMLEMANPVSDNRKADMDTLAGKVNIERLSNNPIVLDADDIKAIYESIVL